MVDAAAIADGTTLHVFAVNRSVEEAAPVRMEVPGCRLALVDAELLTAPGVDAANTWAHPDAVVPTPCTPATEGGRIVVELPPHSFLAATVTPRPGGSR